VYGCAGGKGVQKYIQFFWSLVQWCFPNIITDRACGCLWVELGSPLLTGSIKGNQIMSKTEANIRESLLWSTPTWHVGVTMGNELYSLCNFQSMFLLFSQNGASSGLLKDSSFSFGLIWCGMSYSDWMTCGFLKSETELLLSISNLWFFYIGQ